MRSILPQACVNTLASLRIWPPSFGWIAFWAATAFGPIVPIYYARGGDEAWLEVWENFYSLVIVFGIALLVFLYHLWLAPYKMIGQDVAEQKNRIDKIVSAGAPARVVDEDASRRAALNVKRDTALRDMRCLCECITSRMERNVDAPVMRVIGDFDYDYIALRDKYDSWVPSDMSEQGKLHWVKQIIAVLSYNDYDEAENKIKQAMTRQKWDSQEGRP